MGSMLDCVRASRYRRLALAENDKAIADLLYRLAYEAEQGLLVTADRRPPTPPQHRLTTLLGKPADGSEASYESVFPW
ncbi:MAG TPA: hypothetical protein VFL62_11145 [Bradyrhizobium sp.]|uniref:hypothetical protein n=1 Tax=Bradyrhizobium sp. TaxID=376 RepID=UPI002D8048ED|nr:hypothetical protein [Bradyrhizobium sp.]HET7886773.1 hypothetical protein [Bradyrhizobium sp.]